jgi:hypothetical protein
MIDGTMYGLVGRNAVLVCATAAAALLIMQLRTSGIDNYAFGDVLSILLIAMPVMTRATRPAPHRRRAGSWSAAGGQRGRNDDPRVALRPPSRPSPADTEAGVVEHMLARGVALVITFGVWLLAVVLVLLQAWAPAISALIVFGMAAAGVPAQVQDTPVAPTPGNGAS